MELSEFVRLSPEDAKKIRHDGLRILDAVGDVVGNRIYPPVLIQFLLEKHGLQHEAAKIRITSFKALRDLGVIRRTDKRINKR